MSRAVVRPDVSVALAVWRALFLREASTRLSTGRAAWLWLLLEPAAHIVVLMVITGVIQHRVMPGINIEIFILIGVCGFFLVRNVASRGMEAINANLALFAYRQVRPVDTVLVRAAVEAVVYVMVAAILLYLLALFGVDVRPTNPLLLAWAAFLLWVFGVGLALSFSVAGRLLPEAGRLIRLVFTPLYFLSAVMYPVASIPHRLRDVLLFNPIVHGLEGMRGAYFARYHGDAHIDLGYLGFCSLSALLLGLALHTRFATRMVAQ